MADAFISYSRKDKAFATALKARLEAEGFEILFDLEDILGSEDWARRLVDMIAAADHVVFVISPDSCQSRVCSVEVTTAIDLSKSIVPVALRETPPDLVPPAIAARQWIDCVAAADPAQCAGALGALFKTSPEWLRQHTELTGRARDWHLAQRRSALLRGSDLRRAGEWLRTSDGKDPPPSGLQIDFINESQRWSRTRRAIATGLAVLTIASAAVAWTMIESERRLSADNRLVSIASDWMDRDPTKAALVLLGVVDPERTPYARQSLTRMLTEHIASCEVSGHAGGVRSVTFSPNGEYIMTIAGDASARIWRAAECHAKPTSQIALEKDGIEHALFTADSKAILVLSIRNSASLWGLDGKQLGAPLQGEFASAWVTRTGDVLLLRKDFTVELWQAQPVLAHKTTFTPFAHLPGFGAAGRAYFAASAGRLMVPSYGSAMAAWTLGDAGDATLVPAGGELLAVSPDARLYARSQFVEQRGREYRRSYDVMVRSLAAPVDPTLSQEEDLREAEHDGLVSAAAFSPDGSYLVTASGAEVQVSDLRSSGERKVVRLEGHTGPVRGIQTAAAGDRFVTFGDDRTARVWRFDGLSTSELFRGHAGRVVSAALSPDGHMLATGSEDGIARIWNLEPGTEPNVLKTRGRTGVDAWFTADDQFIVAQSNDPEVQLEAWRPGSPAGPVQFRAPEVGVKAIARHPRAASIAFASNDGELAIRSFAGDSAPRRIGNHPDVNIIAFDDLGGHLVSASRDGRVQVWNIDGDASPVSFALPPDADMEALRENLQKDPRNEKLQDQAIEMGLLAQARGTFEQIAILTNTGRVLAADATSVFSWPSNGARAGIRLNPGDKLIEAAAFDPTGKYVATAHAWDYTVRLWNADGSGLVPTLGAATESIEALKFSPDGKHLLVASKDETLRLWPTGRDSVPIVLRGHTSWVVDADFTRDSKRVVTQSYDGTARVWNVDGSDQEVILGLANYAARFDSTGSRVVTVSNDSRVAVWSLDAKGVQQALSARTRICLDEAFRTRFVGEDSDTAAAKAAECRRQRQP